MLVEQLPTYIASLPIPKSTTVAPMDAVQDLDNLPDGIVSGSTMIGFEPDLDSELRKSVALSLTAAQKVASADSVVVSPDLWVQRHEMVLRGLNWTTAAGGTAFTERAVSNVAVHKAIIPFLTAVFGPAVAATSLIISALQQLRKMNEDSPWITIFEQESRRFDITEFRFATASLENGTVMLRFAAVRFVATGERLQILFFKKNDVDVYFRLATRTMAANPDLLESMNGSLQQKLQGHTDDFISGLDLGPI